MLAAPVGSVYIWPVSSTLGVARRLAEKVGRTDLSIFSQSYLEDCRWAGCEPTGLTVDHACRLNAEQLRGLTCALARIRP